MSKSKMFAYQRTMYYMFILVGDFNEQRSDMF